MGVHGFVAVFPQEDVVSSQSWLLHIRSLMVFALKHLEEVPLAFGGWHVPVVGEVPSLGYRSQASAGWSVPT